MGRKNVAFRPETPSRQRVSLSNGNNLQNQFWDTWLANVVLENPRLLRRG